MTTSVRLCLLYDLYIGILLPLKCTLFQYENAFFTRVVIRFLHRHQLIKVNFGVHAIAIWLKHILFLINCNIHTHTYTRVVPIYRRQRL